MGRRAARFLQWRKSGWLGLGRAERTGHETNRRLVRRSIEVAADDGIIRVVSSADPFQELSHLLFARRIFHLRSNEMSDIDIKEPAFDLETRGQRDTVVGSDSRDSPFR